eukprot:TRINITY_DN13938_c0_g1_i1.p1 TRINITY_DN13938_c0_g1~~TRINITY_DN13938_c0_g1_i1.p1  ORF type:complete len:1029 (+),score=200.07 TRINITY_DN13938_c0_g1_i1:183-3089(+)
MAVTSGDKALDNTKSSNNQQMAITKDNAARALTRTREGCNSAVDACFATAQVSIQLRTEELLTATASLAKAQIFNTVKINGAHVQRWWRYLSQQEPVSKIDTFPFLWEQRKQMWADRMSYADDGLTAFAIYTFTSKVIQMFESGATVANPPDGYHHVKLSVSNGTRGNTVIGTVMEGGEFNRTLDPVNDGPRKALPGGQHEPIDCRTGKISPRSGRPCDMLAVENCRNGLGTLTKGHLDDGYCVLEDWFAADVSIVPLVKAVWGDQARDAPLIGVSGFLGYATFSTVSDHTGKLLMTWVAMDARAFSTFLSTIQVGGPTAISRILLVVESNWVADILPLPVLQQQGHMVAVSHGNASTQYYEYRTDIGLWGWQQKTREATMAQDPIIRGTARHIVENVNGSYAGLKGSVVLFQMNSTLAGGGWTEDVPGASVPTDAIYGPPQNYSFEYVNGYSTEAESTLAPKPGFVADGTEFFAAVQEMKSNDFLWWLTVVIDREYILGATDKRERETKEQIQRDRDEINRELQVNDDLVEAAIAKSNKQVQDDLDRDRIILYAVIAGSAAVLMVLSVVFVGAIIAPIVQLEEDMADVAVMKLENVDENQPRSNLAEVGRMQGSFLQMIKNLREYRSYMPASVLCDDSEEDAPEEEEEDTGSNRRSSRGTTATRETRETKGTGGGSAADLHRQSITRTESHAQTMVSKVSRARKAVKSTELGLTKKKVSLLTINVQRFSLSAVKVPSERVVQELGRYLQALMQVVQKSKGIPDCFNADRFYASYGALKPVATNKTAACVAAWHCVEQAGPLIGAIDPKLTLSTAVAAGDVFCGNMGTEGMKKFCFVGQANSIVHRLEQYNYQFKTFLMVDGPVANEASQKVRVRMLPQMPTAVKPVKVFHVTAMQEAAAEDEWMYQLEEANKGDPNAEFNRAMDLFHQGGFQEARAILLADNEKAPSEQHDLVLQLVEEKMARADAQ